MYQDNFFNELIIDNFAGGGGASVGIELAVGRPVDIAINHNPDAIAMHAVNHPYTTHYIEDVFVIDPMKVTGGRPVGIAWFSPDYRHCPRTLTIIEDLKEGELKIAEIARKHQVKWQSVHKIRRKLEADGEL